MPDNASSVTRAPSMPKWGSLLDLSATCAVVLGAALGFAVLVVDYYSAEGAPSFGTKQALAMVLAVAAMGAGASVEVWRGRRTLAETLRFWGVTGQMALLAVVVDLYQIENRIFFQVIFLLILFGFIAHHYLPQRLRLPFFVFLGVSAIALMLGAAHPLEAVSLIGLSLGIIGVASLPVPLLVRVAALLAIGAVLALARVGVIEVSGANIVVPLLAAVFMVRLAVFLYDRHNKRGPKGVWGSLAYFFLPPSPVFPFFPVIDFAAFGRTYYNEDAVTIYQRGAGWVLRGVLHLLFYRIVYLHLSTPPENVNDPLSFFAHITTNYALYFKISGQFHLIVGLLLLFGFNLRETHGRFYLSNSFIDFWRRVNIYWKDFMQKMFFNPAYLRLKKAGAANLTAMVGAIAVTFFATWALHSYQWFWLRGSIFFMPTDIIFWALLGVFLAVQTVLEDGRRGVIAGASPTLLGPRAFLVLRTVCTMFTICVLWSFWTSNSIRDWFEMVGASGLAPLFDGRADHSLVDWLKTLADAAVLSFAAAIAMGFQFKLGVAPREKRTLKPAAVAPHAWRRSAAMVAALGLALVLPQLPNIKDSLGVDAQLFVESISDNRLSERDQSAMTRGYYENVTSAFRFNSPLWSALMFRPNGFRDGEEMAGMRQRDDYIPFEFLPGARFTAHGARYVINRWGMRDDDYTLAKPPNTVRIALVEASRAAGFGVAHADTFEARLERRLNADLSPRTHRRYEILNFSVDGYPPIAELLTLEQRVWRFQPDIVLFIGGVRDPIVDLDAQRFREGRPAPYLFLDDIYRRAGIRREMSADRIVARLAPYRYEAVRDIYQREAQSCRDHGAVPVWFYLSILGGMREENPANVGQLLSAARAAGFVMLDLPDVFAGHREADLQIGSWDYAHPNPFGHALVADALYQRLLALDQAGAINLHDAARH